MSVDLIEFLNARLDEDEALARHAESAGLAKESPMYLVGKSEEIARGGEANPFGPGYETRRLYDPARAMREVALKRRLLEGTDDLLDSDWLASVADVYRDHPDFDPMWTMEV